MRRQLAAALRTQSQVAVYGWLAAVGLGLLLCSCASLGPRTIPRDQFDYGAAIRNSSKDQLLSNIVGLRYIDAPVFVDVSSVINQYSLEGTVVLGAGSNTSIIGGNTANIGGTAKYADRPTITYTPISGRKFASSLLTPVAPENIFALVQAGWPADIILRLTVRSINGIDNEWASPANRKVADPRFTELLRVWGRLRKSRAVGLRRDPGKTGARIFVYHSAQGLTDEGKRDLALLQETLGLDPDVTEYQLSYGLVPDAPNEIKVMTSSILQIMNELAWRIDVPPEHVEDARTGPTFADHDADAGPLIRVHTSVDEPEEGYVIVRNRDHWFYIDDRDVASKRTFAMLQIILSLTDTGEGARGPVVTISN
jgi:hypothetical protein